MNMVHRRDTFLSRPFLTVATIMLFTTCLSAAEFSVTPGIGINLAGISVDNDDDALGRRVGFRGGADLSVALTRWFGVRTGVIYSSKGAAWRYIRENDEGKSADAVDVSYARYIDIPLAAQVTFPQIGPVRPFVAAGVAGSVFLGAYKVVKIDGNEIFRGDKNEDVKNTDFSVVVSGGISYPIGPGNLILEGGYSFGVMDINRNEEESVRNSVAMITAGYRISLRKKREK
jgi:hypothetical protein